MTAEPVNIMPSGLINALVPVDEFIRSGQIIRFPVLRDIEHLDVRVNSGTWYRVANEATFDLAWYPPTALGVYDIDVRYDVVNVAIPQRTYTFRLFVLPNANRAFVSDEVTPAGTIRHTMLVWSGADNGPTLDRPLLVVEGIDADNINNPTSYYALGTEERPNSVPGLFPSAQAEGADIIILDYGDGGRDMRKNAAVVRRALLDLPAWNQRDHDEIDVAGVSMGGVVTRYALAKMEEDDERHRVTTFVSMDAPQQGATFDQVFQMNVRDNASETNWPSALARPAGLQLLTDNKFDPLTDTSNPQWREHALFYNEMDALNEGRGYPALTQNVGVSFGNQARNPDENGPWLAVNLSLFGFSGNLTTWYVVGDLGEPGSLLPRKQTQFRIGAYGAAGESQRYGNPVFIPYNSALDIQPNGSSPFASPRLWANVNGPSFHDKIPEEIIAPLLNRLGYDLPTPASLSVSGPATLVGGQPGTYRVTADNPNATYEYAWEWRVFNTRKGLNTTRDVIPGLWVDAPTAGSVFTKTFSCGKRAEVRATALHNGVAVTSNIRRTYVGGDCNSGGGGGGAFAEGGDRSDAKSDTSTPTLRLGAPTPNPASGSVRFHVTASSESTLMVYDSLGRTVAQFTGTDDNVEIDLTGWPAGVYTVRLTTETDATAQRFVVTR